MTVLAEDTPRSWGPGVLPQFKDIKVKASEKIYEGAALGESTGARGHVAGDRFLGFATRLADNSSGSLGDVLVRAQTHGVVRLTLSSLNESDITMGVWATDDNAFTTTKTADATLIGVVWGIISTTEAWVELRVGTAPSAKVASITDSTGGTGSDTLAVGVGEYTLSFATTLVAITAAEGADLVTDLPITHRFRIISMDWVTTIAGVGASATHVLTVDIGATPVTTLALTITEASTNTIGEVTAGAAGTAADVGAVDDTISIAVAAGTNFTAGEGFLMLRIQNLDTADAAATLADKVDSTIAALELAGILIPA